MPHHVELSSRSIVGFFKPGTSNDGECLVEHLTIRVLPENDVPDVLVSWLKYRQSRGRLLCLTGSLPCTSATGIERCALEVTLNLCFSLRRVRILFLCRMHLPIRGTDIPAQGRYKRFRSMIPHSATFIRLKRTSIQLHPRGIWTTYTSEFEMEEDFFSETLKSSIPQQDAD